MTVAVVVGYGLVDTAIDAAAAAVGPGDGDDDYLVGSGVDSGAACDCDESQKIAR